MAKKDGRISSVNPISSVSSNETTVSAIAPISRISRVAQVNASPRQDQQAAETPLIFDAPPQDSVVVNLSQIKAVQPAPYGNIRRGGFMVGDEGTLLRATWAMLGYTAKAAPPEVQTVKLQLLRDLERLMQVSNKDIHALEQAFLQGRSGQVQPQMLGTKLQTWVGKDSVLLDIVAELMVCMGLEGQKLTADLIQHLQQGVQTLNVSKIRLQYLIEMRQKELSLSQFFKHPAGRYIAFQLPQKPTRQHKNKVLITYALSLLGLEAPFTMEQVAATTQAVVIHYAPVNLSQQHVPRPLIRLCSKKVSDTIAAYNLLRC